MTRKRRKKIQKIEEKMKKKIATRQNEFFHLPANPGHQMSVCLSKSLKTDWDWRRLGKKSVMGLKREETSVQSVTFSFRLFRFFNRVFLFFVACTSFSSCLHSLAVQLATPLLRWGNRTEAKLVFFLSRENEILVLKIFTNTHYCTVYH